MEADGNIIRDDEDIEENIVTHTIYRDILPKISASSNVAGNALLKPRLKFDKNYQNVIPLLVKDVVNLKLDENNFGKNLYAYGIQFGAVMLYGICTPKGCDFKSTKLKYTLDDGTGEINIKHAIAANKKIKEKVSCLREEFEINMRKTRKNHKYSDEINQSLNNLLKKTEENINIPETHYKAGSRICVVGIPYKIYNEVWIHAKQIDLDHHQCRDKEILYKEHLIRFYNRYSRNFKLDGSSIDSIIN
ncbi:uncharacterized protein LOC129612885 [Condylostylus longicornis]|uniref:uncharacterized protein LOC129612885 n=1 Tax=Condylostylus longicornis TaxID=2530218 RepID=UPI00244E2369|nr:uncharacterized protein LOC129612885 [Condylostylus longicornis]XP_055382668.1 uncharacterized protein LOC129612885 [Condylostylus longicornis]